MKRREFLKLGSAAIAVAVFPKITEPADGWDDNEPWVPFLQPPKPVKSVGQVWETSDVSKLENQWDLFDPAYDHGNRLSLSELPDQNTRVKMLNILYRDMIFHVPPKYRSGITIVGPEKINYGRAIGISWRYTA